MEHRYKSRRNEVSEISNALSLVATVVSVNAASTENLVRIMNREDTLIDDDALRACVLTHGSCLGLLVRMVEGIALHHDACKPDDLTTTVEAAWRERLRGGAPLSEQQTSTLERVASALRRVRDALTAREGCDDGSSSPSDYSDSESRSSDDMDEDEGTEEEEESEEEEDDQPSAPSRRRRR